jgi:hypothetical protein
MDSTYYSKLEVCGGVVTVSFSKYFLWKEIYFIHHSIHFLKSCCRPFDTSFRRIVEQAVFLPRSSLFMVWKSQKSHGSRSGFHRLDGWVVGFLIHFFQAEHRIQSLNADAPLRKQLHRHPKKGSFKMTITQMLMMVRGWRSCHYYVTPPLQLGITIITSLCIIAAYCRQSTNFSNGTRSYNVFLDNIPAMSWRGWEKSQISGQTSQI